MSEETTLSEARSELSSIGKLNFEPRFEGDRANILDHTIVSERSRITDDPNDLYWVCQNCGERAKELGFLPVVCDD